jgi:hypothetical protein
MISWKYFFAIVSQAPDPEPVSVASTTQEGVTNAAWAVATADPCSSEGPTRYRKPPPPCKGRRAYALGWASSADDEVDRMFVSTGSAGIVLRLVL